MQSMLVTDMWTFEWHFPYFSYQKHDVMIFCITLLSLLILCIFGKRSKFLNFIFQNRINIDSFSWRISILIIFYNQGCSLLLPSTIWNPAGVHSCRHALSSLIFFEIILSWWQISGPEARFPFLVLIVLWLKLTNKHNCWKQFRVTVNRIGQLVEVPKVTFMKTREWSSSLAFNLEIQWSSDYFCIKN